MALFPGYLSRPVYLNEKSEILIYGLITANSKYRYFVWFNEDYLELSGTGLRAFNDDRVFAGYTSVRNPDPDSEVPYLLRAVIYYSGGVLDLGTLGGQDSIALAISNNNKVTGWSTLKFDSTCHPFVWEEGIMKELPSLPGSSFTSAIAISNNGNYMAGYCWREEVFENLAIDVFHAFRWDADGDMDDLGNLGGNFSEACDVNNEGVVVGVSQDKQGSSRGFRSSPGKKMEDLNRLIGDVPYFVISGKAVNDHGDILCDAYCLENDNQQHTLLLKKLSK
jgi:probable HAF family extracellular repeat protein